MPNRPPARRRRHFLALAALHAAAALVALVAGYQPSAVALLATLAVVAVLAEIADALRDLARAVTDDDADTLAGALVDELANVSVLHTQLAELQTAGAVLANALANGHAPSSSIGRAALDRWEGQLAAIRTARCAALERRAHPPQVVGSPK
jgi:hypothetical protein